MAPRPLPPTALIDERLHTLVTLRDDLYTQAAACLGEARKLEAEIERTLDDRLDAR